MAHLPADDAIFVLALAAWWQLRRSAYLLPHLRKGPSSIGVHSGAGVPSWIMAVTLRPLVATRRRAAESRDTRLIAEVLDTVPMAVPSTTTWDSSATTPDLVPVGRRPPLPRPPAMSPRHASIPRPRPAMDPPTYPLPSERPLTPHGPIKPTPPRGSA